MYGDMQLTIPYQMLGVVIGLGDGSAVECVGLNEVGPRHQVLLHPSQHKRERERITM